MDQPRPPILRRAEAADRAVGFDESAASVALRRPGVLIAYSLAMVGCAIAILVVPDIAHPATALIFAGLAVANPLAAHRLRSTGFVLAQQAAELAVIALMVSVAPSFWPVACVWMGTSLTWSAIVLPRRSQLIGTAATLTILGATAWANDATGWLVAIGAAAIVAMATAELGVAIRSEVFANETSMTATLSSAGGFVVHASMDEERILSVHGAVEAVTGWTPEEWCARDPRDVVHPDDVEQYWIDVDAVAPDTVVDRIARYRHRDGRWIWLRDVTRVIVRPDGRFMHGFLIDITELVEANVEISHQARRDSLTQLPNRLALVERLEQHLADEVPFALLLLDLDRFKEINDTLGHEAGDRLLSIVATRLNNVIPDGALLARLGGDEFAIVVPDATCEGDLGTLLDDLSSTWARPMTLRGVRTATSASIGVVFSCGSDADRATLMRHADIAMYEAKRSSSGACFFDDSLEHTSTMQLTLSAALPTALADGEIKLYFQPKVDMATGRVVGAEGLARWEHDEFGVLTPYHFLDLTLMSEYAVPFALRTIDNALAAIELLTANGSELPIAANVAIGALRDMNFGDEVLHRLTDRRIDPRLLTIELTESDVLGPSSGLSKSFDQLTAAGVTMSIDDFGTGHSSLERLRVLDVGELKIDRSFVDGMTDSPLDRKIVETIIDLSRRLDCNVIAEGVETDAQKRMLLDMGCDSAQGFLFARPMPLDQLVEMVTSPVGSPVS